MRLDVYFFFQSSVTNASLSGSEGGSGDGTIGSLPLSPKHSTDGMLYKDFII